MFWASRCPVKSGEWLKEACELLTYTHLPPIRWQKCLRQSFLNNQWCNWKNMPAGALDCCKKFAFVCNLPGYETLTKCVWATQRRSFGLCPFHSYLCTVVDYFIFFKRNCTLSKTSFGPRLEDQKKKGDLCCVSLLSGCWGQKPLCGSELSIFIRRIQVSRPAWSHLSD